MTRTLWLPQAAAAPTPSDIASYLLQAGWLLEKAGVDWAIYWKDIAEGRVSLEVPQRAAAPDYPRAVGLLIADLARIEDRPASLLLRDIHASSVDLVRLAIDSSSTRDGRIPVEAGRRVYAAAREMLLAAACSVIDAKPVFARRKPDEAMRLLDRAKFGQTEIGSFVLTIECGVSPPLQPALVESEVDPDAPLERRAYVRLAHALRAAEEASRESAAAADMQPFRTRTKDGISANLCESISEIIDATDAQTLNAVFSFASRRSVQQHVPRSATFSADTSAIFREAAKRLRDEATYPATDVLGIVVKLDSQQPASGGVVVVRADVEGTIRHVRVHLDAEHYQQAIVAHGSSSLVRCTGDLSREGISWLLRNPRDFTTITQIDE